MDMSGRFKSLTPREREVIGLAAAGLVDKQIGTELNVSLNTLRTYWTRIRDKAGSDPRPALVAAYVREELEPHDNFAAALEKHEGWVLDPKTGMQMCTDGINDDYGLQRGVPHHMEEYAVSFHPDDVEESRRRYLEVIEGKVESVLLVFRVISPTGIRVARSTIHSIKDENGQVVKVYGFRAESHDCRAGNNATVRTGHWEEELSGTKQGHFTFDEELAAMSGRPGIGKTMHGDYVPWRRHPEDDERVRRSIQDAIASKQVHLTTDVRMILDNGQMLWGRANRRFVYREDGGITVYGTFSVFE